MKELKEIFGTKKAFVGASLLLVALGITTSTAGELPPQMAKSSATPLSAKLSVVDLPPVDLQPLGKTEGTAPPSYSETVDNAEVDENVPVVGLDLGLATLDLISMSATAGSESSSDLELGALSKTAAQGSANDVSIKLASVELLGAQVGDPAIEIIADKVESASDVTGALGTYAVGGSNEYTNLVVKVLGVPLASIPATPAVNTEISLDAAGLAGATLMLNEVNVEGDDVSGYTVTRNSVRLSLDAVDLGVTGLGLVSGDIVVGHSVATQLSDSDSDGIDDFSDGDADGDGIPSALEIASSRNGGDSDGDLLPDAIDLDSDGDGISDLVEAGGTDPDGDGKVSPSGDGNPDEDGDGIVDTVDPDDSIGSGLTGTALSFPDTDLDGVADTVDLDSDNDGVSDQVEGAGDADGDLIASYLDSDSDNDTIADVVEAGGTDVDGNGKVDPSGDGNPDEDGDGIVDTVDPDDAVSGSANGVPLPNPDTDGDTVADILDRDSDNDGISDATEALRGDADNDGVANYIDLDSDNDGINDVIEGGGVDVDGDGMVAASDDGNPDEDGDGVLDTVDPDDSVGSGLKGVALTIPDTDLDLVPDYLDLDSDNDTISDILESGNGLADRNHDGLADGSDADLDGIAMSTDGLPGAFGDSGSSALPDFDEDGLPNYLDPDSDGDGTTDIASIGNGTLDSDGDGMIDLPIVDIDQDGVSDAIDSDDGNPGGTAVLISGDEWRESILDETQNGWGDDPDGDGACNCEEFFAGTDPNDVTSKPKLQFELVTESDASFPQLRAQRDPRALAFGQFQISTDIEAWSSEDTDIAITAISDEELIARGAAAIGPNNRRAFMRLVIMIP